MERAFAHRLLIIILIHWKKINAKVMALYMEEILIFEVYALIQIHLNMVIVVNICISQVLQLVVKMDKKFLII